MKLGWNLAVPTVLGDAGTQRPRRVSQAGQPDGFGAAEVAWPDPACVAWGQRVAQAEPAEPLRLGHLGVGSLNNR